MFKMHSIMICFVVLENGKKCYHEAVSLYNITQEEICRGGLPFCDETNDDGTFRDLAALIERGEPPTQVYGFFLYIYC